MNVTKISDYLLNMSNLALAIRAELLGENAEVNGVGITPVGTNAEVVDGGVSIDGAEPVAPVYTQETPAPAPAPVAVATADVELDDEGFPWDERIHAGTKTKVASKLVKGGKAWKMKRGVDPAIVKAVREELKPAIAQEVPLTTETLVAPAVAETPAVAPAVAETPAVAPAPAVATAPVVPVAPAVATAPVAPVAPAVVDDVFKQAKQKAIDIVNKMVDQFSIEYNDIVDLLSKEFQAPNGFQDLTDDKVEAVATRVEGIFNQYVELDTMRTEIYTFGGEAHAPTIDEGFKTILAPFSAETIGAVHWSDLVELKASVQKYHDSWSVFAKQLQGQA